MAEVRWKLADYLETHNLTAYKLAKTLGSETRAPTVYRLARRGQEPSRVDLPTLAGVLRGLRKLTGEEVTVADVLEFVEVPEPEPEDAAWLEAALVGEADPYNWGEVNPAEVGKPVRYLPGRGWVVGE